MNRIGILTAGGDTPALNSTIYGAVQRANQHKIEIIGLMRGFSCLFDKRLPHVFLNPLFGQISELDPTKGGTILGASRDYVDANDSNCLDQMTDRLMRLKIEGVICVGGDGTLNGMQPLCERLPMVLAAKTIDNDLGLNYSTEANDWVREPVAEPPGYVYRLSRQSADFDLQTMVNYVTPGFATAVFVAASGVERIRTTAESHRRIAIVEVMGRYSGYIALGSTYGQPDLVLVPESPVNFDRLVKRVKEIYEVQQNVVIVCGEGVVDERGHELGSARRSTDPAGNPQLAGASERLRDMLIQAIGDNYFRTYRRLETAAEAIFTRKIGHTQRGGRPLLFDRLYGAQIGGKAVDMLLEGRNNFVAVLQWRRDRGFHVESFNGQHLRDRWGHIHARRMHPSFYDPTNMSPSKIGIEYLLPIFTNAVGHDDVEIVRQTIFDSGNLLRSYHSVNTDLNRHIQFLDT